MYYFTLAAKNELSEMQQLKIPGYVLSHVQLFVTPWTVALQATLSMAFSKHRYWSGLPFPTPGHLPHPGTDLRLPASPALASRFFFYHCTTWEALNNYHKTIILQFYRVNTSLAEPKVKRQHYVLFCIVQGIIHFLTFSSLSRQSWLMIPFLHL